MRNSQNKRYQEYLDILNASGVYKNAFKNTCEIFLKKKGENLQLDSKLYLMVFAPTLVGFVKWVIEHAIQNGKERLYFLSRDGYQMYLIAKYFVEKENIPIECRYLYVSRYSMRIPGYHLDIEKGIDSICVGGIDVTLIKILKRGGLTEDECNEVVGELRLGELQDKILNYHQIMKLKEQLYDSKYLRRYMLKHSKEAYDNTIGYLTQEGLCVDDRFAIVDSGWIGTLQSSIEKLVQSVNLETKIDGYYFGMYDKPIEMDKSQFNTYYFSAKKGVSRKIRFSNSLFETIVSSEEGMTIGYVKDCNKYIPVFNESKNPNLDQMKRNIEALKIFLQCIEFEEDLRNSKTMNQKLAEQLLSRFMSNPTMLECSCYGNNLFTDDVLDGAYKEVATKLTWQQIKDQRFVNKILSVLGIKKTTIYESAWLEGSVVRAINNDATIDKIKKGKKLSSEFKHIRAYKRFVFLRKQMKRK